MEILPPPPAIIAWHISVHTYLCARATDGFGAINDNLGSPFPEPARAFFSCLKFLLAPLSLSLVSFAPLLSPTTVSRSSASPIRPFHTSEPALPSSDLSPLTRQQCP
ncbi:unnamed protein product [Mortierella alpina]